MRIIINISKEDYESIKYNTNKTGSDYLILNGKILPKGHGDLIDRNSILCEDCKCELCEHADICSDILAPTIVEADGGDAE